MVQYFPFGSFPEFTNFLLHIGDVSLRYRCVFRTNIIDARQFGGMAIERVVSERCDGRKCHENG